MSRAALVSNVHRFLHSAHRFRIRYRWLLIFTGVMISLALFRSAEECWKVAFGFGLEKIFGFMCEKSVEVAAEV